MVEAEKPNMSEELRRFLQEIAGHIRLADEQLATAKAQLTLAQEKLQAALTAKERV